MGRENLTRTHGTVTRADRARALGQSGAVVWLTGLSGSGKSTIAYALEAGLAARANHTYVLDGDNLRHGLCADLGFSARDRAENIRRVGRVAALLADAGLIAICAFISPFAEGRAAARLAAGQDCFLEIFLDVDIAVCERRDPKGLYAKARRGEIENFTGIDSPYEKPLEPELALDTDTLDLASCVASIITMAETRGVIGLA